MNKINIATKSIQPKTNDKNMAHYRIWFQREGSKNHMMYEIQSKMECCQQRTQQITDFMTMQRSI